MFGHRNGSEWFRILPECRRGYRNPPGEVWALLGREGRERAVPGGGARPPHGQSELDKEGGALSLSLSLSFLPPSSLLVGLGKGSPTPTRRRTPPSLGAPLGRPALPPCSFIYGAGGAPQDTQVDP